MSATIEPEPAESVREAILAALRPGQEEEASAWSDAALLEGVDTDETEP